MKCSGDFSSKTVLFPVKLLLEKRRVFVQAIKLYPPTALKSRNRFEAQERIEVTVAEQRQFSLRFQGN